MLLALCGRAQSDNPNYDKALAERLGGDDYGMKAYVLVLLKTGPRQIDKKEVTDSLFRGHMANIGRLAAEGKLVVAGPLKKNEKAYRGIFILNVKTLEEAQALLAADPAVKEELLAAELYQWYGSAALSEYLKAHERIEKKKM
ncbi:MAG TPA: YciI family protein [Chitinophagaceae bacterium]|nr:YciI family protein [Chitinophagaceae bacterium]